MSVAILLVLPIFLSGYIFGSNAYYFKYRLMRTDGYHLYFSSAVIGVLFVASSTIIFLILEHVASGCVRHLISRAKNSFNSAFSLHSENHFELILIGLLSMLLSYLVAVYWNKRVKGMNASHRYAIKDDDFEKLLYDSNGEKPISFTMENGKVYIGLAFRSFRPDEERKSIRILPLRSGFRNKDSGKVEYDTFYMDLYERLSLVPAGLDSDKYSEYNKAYGEFIENTDDFSVVLPIVDIKSAHFFDVDVFEEFQKMAKESEINKSHADKIRDVKHKLPKRGQH